jgi:hypothetical protein
MSRLHPYRIAALFLLAWLLMVSCTERIDIELDSTYRRLVVQGAVTSDSVRHRVFLSTTSDYFSNMASPRVSGAQVELSFEGPEDHPCRENPLFPGLYETPVAFRGEVGTTYVLDISQVDVDEDGQKRGIPGRKHHAGRGGAG